jgi:hypothetical protein
MKEPYTLPGLSTSGADTTATPILRCVECGGVLRETREGLACCWRGCPAFSKPQYDDE